ncbi:hypothetical protein [Acidisoma silvae]|uniref:Uncharacterized protein n=1 Tax=Acidisoma silvae TaxID=2802396 RepID=A0A963YWM4_9PROT|nr:hypothetical protein [Acidisoma silvae]MCB8877707.1 hypothetical protein [Acidisoma silvae]
MDQSQLAIFRNASLMILGIAKATPTSGGFFARSNKIYFSAVPLGFSEQAQSLAPSAALKMPSG